MSDDDFGQWLCGERFPGYPGTRCGLPLDHEGDCRQRGDWVSWPGENARLAMAQEQAHRDRMRLPRT